MQQSPRGCGALISSTLKAISMAVFLTALGACSSQVTVHDPSIPDPVVEKIPMSVAVKFPDVFEHFVHEEQVTDKKKWTVDLGRSNALLFTKLFGAMFNDLTVIDDDVDTSDMPIDALIEPSIDAFEFSVPSQSHTSSFAVWIRYRIKIFDSEGKLFANWPISAYGKSLSTAMGFADRRQESIGFRVRGGTGASQRVRSHSAVLRSLDRWQSLRPSCYLLVACRTKKVTK